MNDTIIWNFRYLVTSMLMASSFLVASVALAAAPQSASGWGHGEGMRMPGIFGTVTSINGTTITIDSRGFGPNATQTTYSVDANGATVTKGQATSSLSSIAVGDMISVQGTVNGNTVTATAIHDGMMLRGMGERGQGVFGTVTAVNGSTITIESKSRGQGQTQTSYTVNANGATVTKNGTTVNVGDIDVGDTLMVQGTLSGTTVTATAIHDGIPQGGPEGRSDSIIQGNGEPIIGGTIAAINGSTLTIKNKSDVTYTVNASAATIDKGHATSSLSSLAIGDNVVVQGTVNGSSVTATSIIDSGAAPQTANTNGGNGKENNNGRHNGFGGMFGSLFGGVGGFLHSLFGFF